MTIAKLGSVALDCPDPLTPATIHQLITDETGETEFEAGVRLDTGSRPDILFHLGAGPPLCLVRDP